MEIHTPPALEHKLSIIPEELTTSQPSKSARVQRAQWLRAAILGACDGLLSTATLMLGVSSANHSRRSMILSGLAGAVAGTFSMAIGEFVSVSTQREIEEEVNKSQMHIKARVKVITESIILENDEEVNESHRQGQVKSKNKVIREPAVESEEEVNQSQSQGGAKSRVIRKAMVEEEVNKSQSQNQGRAKRKATREMLGALEAPSPGRSPMMRSMILKGDETEVLPNPLKAALASGIAFLVGAVVPLLSSAFVRRYEFRVSVLVAVTTIALVGFGGFGARLGGSRRVGLSAARVCVGGWLAMGITYWLLKLLDYDDDDGSN